jgi:hypothetical protein
MSEPGAEAAAPRVELRRFHAVGRVAFKLSMALVGLNAMFCLFVAASHQAPGCAGRWIEAYGAGAVAGLIGVPALFAAVVGFLASRQRLALAKGVFYGALSVTVALLAVALLRSVTQGLAVLAECPGWWWLWTLIAGFLSTNTEVVLVVPALVVLVAAVRARSGSARWPLRDSAYIGSCLSLALAYGLLHIAVSSRSWDIPHARLLKALFWAAVFVTPQVFVLLLMGGIALVHKSRNAAYRSPSYGWFAAVAVVGAAWTQYLALVFAAR